MQTLWYDVSRNKPGIVYDSSEVSSSVERHSADIGLVREQQ